MPGCWARANGAIIAARYSENPVEVRLPKSKPQKMDSVRDLKLLPVWVNPGHLAQTALHVMVGHGLKCLGVLEGDKLVGVVGLEDLVGAREGALVSDVMRAPQITVQAEIDVRQAAEQFVANGIDFAPVMDGKRYLGILSPAMLLKELGRSYDPLTRLSWSDRLREWGIENLKASREVTIIFVDLNRFGLYNKKYGHIVGDRVIRDVAGYLSAQIDPELDVLVRYGGDEFAIGTLRDREEAESLAGLLEKRYDGRIEGAEEPVSFSTGVFGGRRHKERENAHYASTVDNLINIASKNCIFNKKRARGEEAEEARRKPEVRILGIFADEAQSSGITTVILGASSGVFSGADAQGDKTIVESLAAATGRCIERILTGATCQVAAIDLVQDGETQVVTVTGIVQEDEARRPVSSAKRVVGDLANAVVEATIEAFL